jgi:hypothetical protein
VTLTFQLSLLFVVVYWLHFHFKCSLNLELMVII